MVHSHLTGTWPSWGASVEPSVDTSISSLSSDQVPPATRVKQIQRPRNLHKTLTRPRTKGVANTKTAKKVPTKKSVGDGKPGIDNQDNDRIDQYISSIGNLTPHTVKVLQGVTPAEFVVLLDAIDDLPIRVKFTYLPKSEQLHIMSPSQLHESSLIYLSTVVHRFIANLNVPSGVLSVELNSKIQNPIPTIPDFLCTLAYNPGDYAVKWAGEVSFAVSPTATRQKMKDLLVNNTSIDLAFIIYIEEDQKWTTPDENDQKVIQLRSKGFISRPDFLEPFPANRFHKNIVVEGLTWASLSKVAFEIFLRHPDDGFDMESTDATCAARGFLYPPHGLEDAGRLFEAGAQRLKESAITLMKQSYGNSPSPSQVTQLEKVQNANAKLNVDWDDWTSFISQRLSCTAYDRYYHWFTTPSPQCKKRMSHTPYNRRDRGTLATTRRKRPVKESEE